jgi:hypothetical protein
VVAVSRRGGIAATAAGRSNLPPTRVTAVEPSMERNAAAGTS